MGFHVMLMPFSVSIPKVTQFPTIQILVLPPRICRGNGTVETFFPNSMDACCSSASHRKPIRSGPAGFVGC